MNWILYAYLTVLSWGVYGIFLHLGRGGMLGGKLTGPEAGNAGLKAFLFVGVAYFVVAIVGPMIVLKMRHSDWSFTSGGMKWSFIAGTVGALGAFTLVLALGAASKSMGPLAPSAVMPIVFGGAPVVNAVVALLLHPPEGGIKSLPIPFVLGILFAAGGGFLVAKYAPTNTGAPAKPAIAAQSGAH